MNKKIRTFCICCVALFGYVVDGMQVLDESNSERYIKEFFEFQAIQQRNILEDVLRTLPQTDLLDVCQKQLSCQNVELSVDILHELEKSSSNFLDSSLASLCLHLCLQPSQNESDNSLFIPVFMTFLLQPDCAEKARFRLLVEIINMRVIDNSERNSLRNQVVSRIPLIEFIGSSYEVSKASFKDLTIKDIAKRKVNAFEKLVSDFSNVEAALHNIGDFCNRWCIQVHAEIPTVSPFDSSTLEKILNGDGSIQISANKTTKDLLAERLARFNPQYKSKALPTRVCVNINTGDLSKIQQIRQCLNSYTVKISIDNQQVQILDKLIVSLLETKDKLLSGLDIWQEKKYLKLPKSTEEAFRKFREGTINLKNYISSCVTLLNTINAENNSSELSARIGTLDDVIEEMNTWLGLK